MSNCPVTSNNAEVAEQSFGPNVGALKGKPTCHRLPIGKSPISQVPSGILKQYCMIMLCVDVMYVNHNAMLVSISRNIKFGTVKAITNNKTPTLMNESRQY